MESLVFDDLSIERLEKRKNAYNLVNSWLFDLQSKLQDYYVNIIDTLSSSTSPTSDRWMMREYDVPGITYEVGDETNRKLIDTIAETSATALMELLIANHN
jgi:hypothetical protein